MKKFILCSLLSISALAVNAQLTQLSENFNSSCPDDWTVYNPIASTIANGAWVCVPTDGRWGTQGQACTGVWSSLYHLDTSYLVSPALNLSGYAGAITLSFDSKTTDYNLAGKIAIIGSKDSLFRPAIDSVFDLSSALLPVFTSGDASDWVTHNADLTPYKADIPLYIAFRYTSDITAGNTWYIDNIYTTTFPAHVSDLKTYTLPLKAIGNSTSSQITLSYKTELTGTYHLCIYDMTGNKAYEEDIEAQAGNSIYTLNSLHLHSGMYLIKMGNGQVYGTAKTIVE